MIIISGNEEVRLELPSGRGFSRNKKSDPFDKAEENEQASEPTHRSCGGRSSMGRGMIVLEDKQAFGLSGEEDREILPGNEATSVEEWDNNIKNLESNAAATEAVEERRDPFEEETVKVEQEEKKEEQENPILARNNGEEHDSLEVAVEAPLITDFASNNYWGTSTIYNVEELEEDYK